MKKVIGYLITTVGLFIFQLVYHHFGHGVTSQSLKFVWVIPLAGLLIWLILRGLFKQRASRVTFNLLNAGITALVFWASVQGILEIAGSDSPYLFIYLIIAGVMGLAALLSLLIPQTASQR